MLAGSLLLVDGVIAQLKSKIYAACILHSTLGHNYALCNSEHLEEYLSLRFRGLKKKIQGAYFQRGYCIHNFMVSVLTDILQSNVRLYSMFRTKLTLMGCRPQREDEQGIHY